LTKCLSQDPELKGWSPSFEWLFSKPRLRGVRETFPGNLDPSSIGMVCSAYQEWVRFHEYLLLKGKSSSGEWSPPVAVLCSKRGNDEHARRLDRRLGFLDSGKLKGIRFFSANDFKIGHIVKTRLLWVTFTFDRKLGSIRDSWENDGYLFHKALERLKKHFNGMDHLAFPQPFDDPAGDAYGCLHRHAVLYFPNHEFDVVQRMVERDGRLQMIYEVKDERQDREIAIASGWHSFVDVQALSSMKGAVNYCRKYAEGALRSETEKGILTNAMGWFFKKHSYSMSHHFRAALSDLITQTSANLSRVEGQLTLQGDPVDVWVWHFYGVWGWGELGGSLEGPPPRILSVSEEVFQRCRAQFRKGANCLD